MNTHRLDPSTFAAELAAARWTTSSRSSGGTNCVQVTTLTTDVVALRDSKILDQPPQLFGSAAYRSFLDGVRGIGHVRAERAASSA